MNYFELYPGDYLRDTGHLSLAQHGAFLLLMAAYYGSEKPFSPEKETLFRLTKAVNSSEKQAAISVADEFFPVGVDGLRHNERADEEIAKAQERMDTQPTDRKLSQAERAKRYRDRRAAMFQLLREHGIVLEFNARSEDLEAAVMGLASRNSSHGASRKSDDVPRDVTASRPQTPDPSNTPVRATTPETILSDVQTRPVTPGTTAGAIAAALNRKGLRITSQNPNVIAAAAEGVTVEHLLELHEIYPDKPASYLVATARRQRTERANPIAPGAKHAQQPGHRPSLADRARRSPAAAGAIDSTATRIKD